MVNQIGVIGTHEMARQNKVRNLRSSRPLSLLKTYNGPPYLFRVLVDGQWKKMSGFDEEHIQNQLGKKQAKKVLKIKEKN